MKGGGEQVARPKELFVVVILYGGAGADVYGRADGLT